MNDMRNEFQRLKRNGFILADQCANCGSTSNLHVHHIVPLALGGFNIQSNICVLCETCHGKVHGVSFNNHSKSSRDGMKRVRKEGKWSNGNVPFGYKSKDGVITIDEFEADIVKLIYNWRYELELSFPLIGKMLRHMAIPARKSHGWSTSTLRQILINEIVFGNKCFNVEFPRIVDESYRDKIESFNKKYENEFFPRLSKNRIMYSVV